MYIDYLFYLKPLPYLILTDLLFAHVAQVSNFSFLRIASCAKIVEEDVNYEVIRKIFSFVLSNVFGTQLHLACFDVVAPLNEGGVEHDTEHSLVLKPCMLKDYFYISS